MARFKIVKHRLRYHVIAFEGTVKPRTKGAKATYKEQCISSHLFIRAANKAKEKYEKSNLKISNKPEPKTLRRFVSELHYAVWLAVFAAIGIEIYLKFVVH